MMISTVIPVYNSQRTIKTLCEKIIKVMTIHDLSYEIIMVDDKSCDNSFLIMEELSKSHGEVISIKLRENSGQQNALLCGIRQATGDYVVTIDDDLQQNPEDIIRLLNAIQHGYDVVYGVPQETPLRGYRHVGTGIKEWIFYMLLHKPRGKKLTAFRIMNRSTVEWVRDETISKVYLSATILCLTHNIGNVPVQHHKRSYGKSNYTFKKLMRLFLYILIYYSKIPLLKYLRQDRPQYEIDKVIGGKA